MRVLVTGATGFIGHHVARRFVTAGWEVFALVRPPAERLFLEGVTNVEGDLADPAGLEALADLPEFDAVCHLAADTRMDVGDAELAPVNVRGTERLLAALAEKLQGRRFLFASSIAAVDRKRRPRAPLTTDDPPAPRSAYARSKLECERIVAAEAKARGFHHANLRLGTIYGPGQETGGLVTLARAARDGGLAARLPWPGRISFGHVEDVAEVFFRLASRPDPVSGTWFVADDQLRAMGEAAVELARVQGREPKPLGFVRPILRMAGFFLWLPGVRRFAPWSLRAALSDTIACDSGPIRDLLELEWTPFADGVRRTFGPPERRGNPDAVRSLVTGATGFLGLALVKDLVAAHGAENVTALVRDPLPDAERAAAEELGSLGVRLVPSDLLSRPAFDADGIEFDALYHLAAETDSAASEERLAVNTVGTRNLLGTLGDRLAGRRVVLAGATAAVDRGRRPRGLMAEEDPFCPRTAYGRSKLEAEAVVRAICDRHGAVFAVPRFSPVWTPALETGFLAAFRGQVEGGSIVRKVGWPGRITMIRRKDAVAILRHLGEKGAADGRAVHVGDGEVYRYAELLRDLRKRAGDKTGFLPVPGFVWGLIRGGAWLPVARKFVPWRLSCLLGDDLAVDTTRLFQVWPGRPTTWPESLADLRIRSGENES